MRFNPKVSAIEEKKHLEKMTMDALRGTLLVYEMRIEDPKKKEAAFKASLKNQKNKKTCLTFSKLR